ncbi:CinA family nicotinamide mononucleotide deamidase-related protein [Colwelliaceae bacterium 6441]
MDNINIQLLLTGNELMVGDIIDSNSAMVAQMLLSKGLVIQRKVTIADDVALLINEIKQMSKQADILIINGGLGPTIDDLTAQAIAQTCQQPLQAHSEAVEHLKKWGGKRNIALDETHLKQAMLPKGANTIANKNGSALGFHLNFQQCDIYCTPGVPSELEVMMKEEILPKVQLTTNVFPHYQIIRLHTFGIGESKLQQLITTHFPQWPQEISLGFRAASPFLELKLTIAEKTHLSLLKQYKEQLQILLGDHILGELLDNTPSMAEYTVDLLKQSSDKITTAESCTGGLIASMITSVAGASNVFEAGYVTYSNSIKNEMLGVSTQIIEQFGAVSKEVVIEMAKGALEQSSADYVIAVSGIAGPDGGSQEKPVGTVWIAWGKKEKIQATHMCIKGSRLYFQSAVANRSLDLIRRELVASQESPMYLQKLQ